ncbi:27992_t:CDS:2 [Gigaspora margarita]|uniref:27992_t:CDS:1 n=1 Tax=Gigaspora margarita TaxID=4874 RepID=A0ABM8VYG1_GIGMA|nr:27992_t:CDS:2 [Gigaspora margarita]
MNIPTLRIAPNGEEITRELLKTLQRNYKRTAPSPGEENCSKPSKEIIRELLQTCKEITRELLQTQRETNRNLLKLENLPGNCFKPDEEVTRELLQTRRRKLPETSPSPVKKLPENCFKPVKILSEKCFKPGEEITRQLFQTRRKELSKPGKEITRKIFKGNYQRKLKNVKESSLTFWSLSLIELLENYQRTAPKQRRDLQESLIYSKNA